MPITEVRYSYKNNPAQYCMEDVGLTLAVTEGESASEVVSAARALVMNALGLEPAKSDIRPAKRWLQRHYGDDAKLSDFRPKDKSDA